MRYVIKNVKSENFKKMGLAVTETENGFAVEVSIYRFEEQIINAGDEAVLNHSDADLIEFQNNRFLNFPFMFRDQIFNFNFDDDGQLTCEVGKRSKNDYKTLEFLLDEYIKTVGDGQWICPEGRSNG